MAWHTRYPAACVVAGVAAGLLGIGGGMVLGPLLVALGCLPQPVAATSALPAAGGNGSGTSPEGKHGS